MSRKATALTGEEIEQLHQSLPEWQVVDGVRLQREFKFDTFARAMGWMTAVAIVADKLDHHPNWSNVYNRVDVTLWTHSLGRLSQFDRQLALAMDRLAG